MVIFPTVIFASSGTILSGHSYAWSNNVGWLNFSDTTVTDSALTGYAWSQNNGWISLAPTQSGVVNDGSGNLSGYAWGEGVGWINFAHVTIDSSGNFTGTASGDTIGTLTFDCTYCDVQTDWSAATTEEEPSGTSGGGGGFIPKPTAPPTEVEIYDEDLIVSPDQSGVGNWSTPLGPVVLQVPKGAVAETTRFSTTHQIIVTFEGLPDATFPVNGAYYTIDAQTVDANDPVHAFAKPLRIFFPLSPDVQDLTQLQVYWQDATSDEWYVVPGAAFAQTGVTFEVNHLTKFVILRSETPLSVEEQPTVTEPEVVPPTTHPNWPTEQGLPDEQPEPQEIDIQIEQPTVAEKEEISTTITFPVTTTTPMTVTYEIVNQNGTVVYTEDEDIVAEVDLAHKKDFAGMDLPAGEYTIRMSGRGQGTTTTLFTATQTLQITQSVQASEPIFQFGAWGWIVSIMLGIAFVWWIKRVEENR